MKRGDLKTQLMKKMEMAAIKRQRK